MSAEPRARSKFSLLAAVLVLLLVAGGGGALRPLRSARRGPADLQGAWEGALQVQTVKLHLVLKIQKAPDGSCTATMDNVDQGAAMTLRRLCRKRTRSSGSR